MNVAVPYSETNGCERFKEFLDKPFTPNMLDPENDEHLFTLWFGSDNQFQNQKKFKLTFLRSTYTTTRDDTDIAYTMSIPKTINDFLVDMWRLGIDVYWSDYVDQHFEPSEYLKVSEIKKYWEDLLFKMEKGFELM